MDYNQLNSQFNGAQRVPPYPQPNFDNRASQAIIENKESEESFINNILRKSINKEATYYFSYPDSIKWRDVVYEGKLLTVGEDYIVVEEKDSKEKHVLLLLYLEWVVFK